ncbi:MAG: hypothetical protein R3D25_17490 [Geminicoccaceae bacterium]
MLALVSVVWFAYQDMMPGGDEAPPVVRAEVGPLKREPNERGGAPVVNEESVVVQALNEPDAPVRVERLIPRDEPAPRSAADVIPDALQAEPPRPGPPRRTASTRCSPIWPRGPPSCARSSRPMAASWRA